MNLTQDWMKRFSSVLKVAPQEIISDPPLKRIVYIEGSIEQNGEVDNKGDVGESSAIEFEVELGTNAPDVSLWYLTEADMFPPAIQAGDLLRFTQLDSLLNEEMIGRICMLHLARGTQPVVGVLSRGSTNSQYNLTRPDGRLIKDLSPSYISVLTMSVAFPRFTYDEDGVPATAPIVAD